MLPFFSSSSNLHPSLHLVLCSRKMTITGCPSQPRLSHNFHNQKIGAGIEVGVFISFTPLLWGSVGRGLCSAEGQSFCLISCYTATAAVTKAIFPHQGLGFSLFLFLQPKRQKLSSRVAGSEVRNHSLLASCSFVLNIQMGEISLCLTGICLMLGHPMQGGI